MKILVLNGSPKKHSDTMHLTNAFLSGMKNKDAHTVEIIHVIEKEIKPCTGCFACWETQNGKCIQNDDQNEILRKINLAIKNVRRDSFLRITLTGQSAFGLTINSDALKQHFQNRIFFVEVYDNTVMEIDEESFDTDISLRSEFVRLAMADNTLSESERNRLISCGWNALIGKEVSEE